MPSESVETQGVSSPFLSEEGSFRDERGGFWKKDAVHNFHGMKSDGGLIGVASSPIQKRTQMESQIPKGFNYPDQKVNINLQKLAIGSEKATSLSLPRAFEHNVGSASYFTEGDKSNFLGATYDNSIFSSSLSELLSRKLRLSSQNSGHGHSINDEEDMPLGSLKELEAQTIGNLLPEDDELFSGINNGVDSNTNPINGGDIDDLDLFYSGGGFDLGEDGSSSIQKNPKAFIGGTNDITSVEQLSRTLLVRNISINLEESDLKAIFEQFGEIRTLYTASKDRGFVIVSYFDIRAARNAVKGLHGNSLMHRTLHAQYSIPEENPGDKDINQGSLVVFFLDSPVPNTEICQVFGAYGEIREIRETQHRNHHKFIEYYDVRAAEAALRALNRSEISGNRIKVELNRPSNAKWSMHPFSSEMEQNGAGLYMQQNSPPANLTLGFSDNARYTSGLPMSSYVGNVGNAFQHGISSSSVPNNLSSMLSQSNASELNQLKFDLRAPPNFHPLSLPDSHDALSTHLWSNNNNNSHNPQMWPNSNSPSFRPQQMHSVRAPSHLGNGLFPINNHNHHVGSAPPVNPPLWERRHTYTTTGESPDASVFHPGSLGRVPGTSPHFMEFIPHSLFPHNSGPRMDLPISSHHNQRGLIIPTRGQMIPVMNSFGSPNERSRNRRHEGSSNQAETKKQFELDVDRILRGEDKRTTLMIKNIPNKYTSKMLLVAIDERHRGTYDFLYLPIDFKNKCNVGYAFINMIDPTSIVPFYQALNGKKWEKFNSEKVASLAYARIQGKAALISHFQNSSLMNEDKRCRPILFHTDGPNAGDQVPFPVGVNIRTRPGKNRSNGEENNNNNNNETPPNSGNEEESSSN